MRLWHKDIIRFLPKGQLVSQWKELGSIYKNQNKHILINYIYKTSDNTRHFSDGMNRHIANIFVR